MTRHLDPDRTLEDWLAEGPSQLPDQAVHHIVRLLDETEQRKPTWLSGSTLMNRINFSLGAAVVGVAVLAAVLYFSQADTGTAPPSATATPDATASSPLPLAGDELEPGTYRITEEAAVPVHVTVPAGWSNSGGWAIVQESAGEFVAGLAFWSPSQATTIYADPCDWEDNFAEDDTMVDHTPTAVMAALARQPRRGDAEPQDVTVDGFAGKVVELTIPNDLDFATCDGGEAHTWFGFAAQAPGQVDRIYVVDVDGELLVFAASRASNAPTDVIGELDSMVQSILVE